MNKKLLTLIVAISILMSIGTAVAPPPSPVSSPVYWTGQGTDSDVDCSDENFKGAPGIHWIATGYNTATTNYNLTINVSGVDEDPVTPYNITGNAIHFYTDYYDFDTLGATLTFDGTMDHNAKVVISHYCPPCR
ncbi:hypothetical protein HNV12_25780 [Methanococcoides sp. SA1]|nr:hypothetical protein [Methanococcoides sp. SA1]